MKTLLIVGTGGTIAGAAADPAQTVGYRYGALSADQLVAAVPGLGTLAEIRTAQPYSIGSEHLGSTHWLQLTRLLRASLDDPAIDAVVILHGTDTLEETAFFLDLALARTRPVIITGAMRPSSAIGADGPANLAAACRFALAADDASDDAAPGPGVLVAFNDTAFSAVHLSKRHTIRVDAFGTTRDAAPVGILLSGSVCWRAPLGPAGRFASCALPAALPPVAVIWQHVDCDETVVDWHCRRGARGIVYAGTGNGTMTLAMRAALARASDAGCLVVRATRVPDGPVMPESGPEAEETGSEHFVAAGWLAPLKARLLLQWSLAAGWDAAATRREFERYR